MTTKENADKITVEMTRFEFYKLRNLFFYNKEFCEEELDSHEYELAKKIISLKDSNETLFDEFDKIVSEL